MLKNHDPNISCWKSNESSTGTVEKIYACPVCSGHAQEVKSITVKHFVKESCIGTVEDGKYHICLNEDCHVVYFNLDQKNVFKKDSIKMPIWFKKDADPKYICYCNEVTENQIIDAIINKDAKNMKDIINITGAMKNGQCETKNPLGKCCGPIIKDLINNTINNAK